MIGLAVATGIPMEAWVEAGHRSIVTAAEIVDRIAAAAADGKSPQPDPPGVVMRG